MAKRMARNQLADAQDPYYNPDKAKAKFAVAKKELKLKVCNFPIHLDVTVDQSAKKVRT